MQNNKAKQPKYRPIGKGQYHVIVDGNVVAEIERTGDEDGWNSTWWWQPLQVGVSGLQTSRTLKGVKALGEAWLIKLDEEESERQLTTGCGADAPNSNKIDTQDPDPGPRPRSQR